MSICFHNLLLANSFISSKIFNRKSVIQCLSNNNNNDDKNKLLLENNDKTDVTHSSQELSKTKAVRYFINLTNGIEAVRGLLLQGVPIEHINVIIYNRHMQHIYI